MAATERVVEPTEQPLDKGLKAGALGLISSTVIATASVAPAYSITATLVFVVLAVGVHAPIIAVLAFVPMLLTSIRTAAPLSPGLRGHSGRGPAGGAAGAS